MPRYAGIYLWRRVRLSCRLYDALGDAEALGVAPGDLPELRCRTPDCAEAQRAGAQVGFVEGDAHGDDLVVAAGARRATRTRSR